MALHGMTCMAMNMPYMTCIAQMIPALSPRVNTNGGRRHQVTLFFSGKSCSWRVHACIAAMEIV